MPIHIGKTPSREGWVGFETDSLLTKTKERLNAKCLPCMTGLYEALKERPEAVELTYAWDCWKVTVVTPTDEEALNILETFGEKHPDEEVYGKYGGSVGRTTSALIFHTESAERRDMLTQMLAALLEESFPGREAFISRGCGNPYEQLLGPWQNWTRTCRVAHPERIDKIRAALRDSLYRNS